MAMAMALLIHFAHCCMLWMGAGPVAFTGPITIGCISSHRISIRSSDVVTDSGSLSTICGDQGAVRRAAHHVDIRLNILV